MQDIGDGQATQLAKCMNIPDLFYCEVDIIIPFSTKNFAAGRRDLYFSQAVRSTLYLDFLL